MYQSRKCNLHRFGGRSGHRAKNRALKVLRGIKGIANSSEYLEEYFLLAAELSNITANFSEKFGIAEDQAWKRENHYQLSESKIMLVKSVRCFIRARSVLMAHMECSIF